MNKKYDVVALGEMLIDFAAHGRSEQGNQLLEVCPGGAPSNVLAMLSKLGKKVGMIGKVGEDTFGRMLKETLDDLGVESKGLLMDPEYPTTLAFVHTLPGGERDFSFYRNPSADMMLRKEEVHYEMIRDSKVFHFGTLSMTDQPAKEATKSALEEAKKAGCLISFDPNLRPPLWKSMEDAKEQMKYGFGYCDILKISDNEIQFITGLEDYEDGIRYLQETYHIPLIFLTLGKDGSRAYYKDIRVEKKGFFVQAIEATGAGDTFCACALNGVLEVGLDSLTEEILEDILTMANAGAAIITTRKGAIRSMPDKEEIEELISK